jgi:hypothetical protein
LKRTWTWRMWSIGGHYCNNLHSNWLLFCFCKFPGTKTCSRVLWGRMNKGIIQSTCSTAHNEWTDRRFEYSVSMCMVYISPIFISILQDRTWSEPIIQVIFRSNWNIPILNGFKVETDECFKKIFFSTRIWRQVMEEQNSHMFVTIRHSGVTIW